MLAGVNATLLIILGLCIVGFFFLIGMVARLYRKAGPHEALVVYGYRKEMPDQDRSRYGHLAGGRKLSETVAGTDVV